MTASYGKKINPVYYIVRSDASYIICFRKIYIKIVNIEEKDS